MRILMAAAVVLAAFGSMGTAQAQSAIESRVDRLEREMRAVQRRVFPGGAGQYFEPQITEPAQSTTAPGLPASSPITDLTQRVTALESQITTLTGQVEQAQYRLRQIEDQMAAGQRALQARLDALEARTAEPAPVAAAPRNDAAPTASTAARPATPRPNAERRARIDAVERPSSGDAAEDAYVYGYRLWQAELYPEAREQLSTVAERHPRHRRASWARNLLGRVFLDEGAPAAAAEAFLTNYQRDPDGERAPDSLFFLAQALRQLNKPSAEICRVYDELLEVYGDRISDQMRTQVADGRRASRCR